MGGVTESSSGGKEKLMRAAQSLFASGGFEETSVAAVLEAAGVRAPTLYYHFGDKEGLYCAWAVSAIEALGSNIQRAIERQAPLRERLIAVSGAFSSFDGCSLIQTLREVSKLKSAEHRDAVVGAYLQSVREPVCSVLLSGIEAGELAAEPLGRMAGTFILGALASRIDLPGSSFSSDPAWWTERFLNGFGA